MVVWKDSFGSVYDSLNDFCKYGYGLRFLRKQGLSCKIRNSHSDVDEDWSLLGYDAMSVCMFWRSLLPSLSGSLGFLDPQDGKQHTPKHR